MKQPKRTMHGRIVVYYPEEFEAIMTQFELIIMNNPKFKHYNTNNEKLRSAVLRGWIKSYVEHPSSQAILKQIMDAAPKETK